MATEDVNLGVQKPQDEKAEIARLREENVRLQAKRDNDERSAFGRLSAEAELRKQREAELAEYKHKLEVLQAQNAKSILSPEELEALGQTGAAGVEKMITAKMAPLSSIPAATLDLTPVLSRLEAIELAQRQNAQRQAYSAGLTSWASMNGAPNLLQRLGPGGDLSGTWAAFAQQNPGAVAAYESGDTEMTKVYIKLFMHENPGISQQAGTPSAAGAFAAPAVSGQYTSAAWLAETDALDTQLKAGQISASDHGKGYAEANAKLAASQRAK